MSYIDVTGKTEEEAIRKGLEQLGMDRDDVSVVILERAKSGFLGIGSSPARVRLTYGPEEAPVAEPAPIVKPVVKKPAEEKPAAPAAKPAAPKAEDRPGVTRGKQWVNVDGGLLLRGQLAGLLQLALPHQGVQVVGQTAVYGVFAIRLGQGAVTPFRKMQRLCVRAFPPHAAWHCGRGGSRPAPRRRIRWACG